VIDADRKTQESSARSIPRIEATVERRSVNDGSRAAVHK